MEFHEVKPGYCQNLNDGAAASEVLFCFEDAKPKIRVAAAQFDEFGSLIVFPEAGDGWSSVGKRSAPVTRCCFLEGTVFGLPQSLH